MQVLGGRGSTKGSNAKTAVNLSGEEHVGPLKPITMGLYVQGDNCTHLVALGKIYDGGSTIHCMAYVDDVLDPQGAVFVFLIYFGGVWGVVAALPVATMLVRFCISDRPKPHTCDSLVN